MRLVVFVPSFILEMHGRDKYKLHQLKIKFSVFRKLVIYAARSVRN
jgi:hypothetical protein